MKFSGMEIESKTLFCRASMLNLRIILYMIKNELNNISKYEFYIERISDMNVIKYLFLFISLSTVQMSFAQVFDKHQWNDRLILLITNDTQSEIYTKQLAEFVEYEPGLKDRKLIIYTITPFGYTTGFRNQNIIKGNELYNLYKPKNEPFRILLIGLDGGIKMDRHSIITREELFGTIDSMPMRKNELTQKKKPE